MDRLVVIGADASGHERRLPARRRLGPEDLQIVALDRGNFSSYSACGIPYFVVSGVGGSTSSRSWSGRRRRSGQSSPSRSAPAPRGARARPRRTGRERWSTRATSGHQREEGFDDLMLGHRSPVPVRPPLPGATAPRACSASRRWMTAWPCGPPSSATASPGRRSSWEAGTSGWRWRKPAGAGVGPHRGGARRQAPGMLDADMGAWSPAPAGVGHCAQAGPGGGRV